MMRGTDERHQKVVDGGSIAARDKRSSVPATAELSL